jgi:hypothetical protein
MLQDLEDSSLLVPGVGQDITSDIATHVMRQALIDFTQQQCLDLGIELQEQYAGPVWSADDLCWSEQFADLPRGDDDLVLFVPKSIVRIKQIFDTDKYYQGYLAPVMENEEIRLATELVRTLKHGEKKVTRTDLKRKYGKDKSAIVTQTERFPFA